MKIIYYYSKLNIGGAERSTVRLLNLFCEKGHDVTLLLRWNGGKLEQDLDPRINRIFLKAEHNTRSNIAKKYFFVLETLLSIYRRTKIRRNRYDICISGLFGYNPGILFRNTYAKQYYQMLRNDVSKTGNFGNTRRYMKRYGSCFDAYIGVSQYTTESFKKAYPEFSFRAHTIYNIIPDFPHSYVDNPYIEYKERLKIVSICRLVDQAKGLIRIANVCAELKKSSRTNFAWFIVGDGPDRDRLKERIRELDLADCMILIGEKSDLYPYYYFSDLVAVLSYYEGLCGVVNEAKQMNKPVIATEFSGIHEQIIDGVNGVIVENCEESILTGMKALLDHPETLTRFQNNGLPEELRDNDLKIRRFETLYNKIEKERKNAKGQCDHSGV